jgi:hypothetical protein
VRADLRCDHLELAAGVRAREHANTGRLDAAARRAPVQHIREQLVTSVRRRELVEGIVEVAAGALDDRVQRALERASPLRQHERVLGREVFPQLGARIEQEHRDVGGRSEVAQRLDLCPLQERHTEHEHMRCRQRRRGAARTGPRGKRVTCASKSTLASA